MEGKKERGEFLGIYYGTRLEICSGLELPLTFLFEHVYCRCQWRHNVCAFQGHMHAHCQYACLVVKLMNNRSTFDVGKQLDPQIHK